MPNFTELLKKKAQDVDTFQPLSATEPSGPVSAETDVNTPVHSESVIICEPDEEIPEPEQTAAPEKSAPKKDRPKKDTPASGEKRKVGRPKKKEERQLTSIVFPLQLHTELTIVSTLSKTHMSAIVSKNSMNAMHNTYECESAACNLRFVLEADSDGKCRKPVCCPCCGGNKIRKINYMKGISF